MTIVGAGDSTVLISIDRYMTVAGVAIIVGWCSDFDPLMGLSVLRDGEALPTTVYAQHRPDVALFHGPGAERWGFRAYATAAEGAIKASRIGLAFGGGRAVISCLAHMPRPLDDNPHGLWHQFVDTVNTRGGTVLEVGARARSGISRKDLFGPNVRYIGVDVTQGPNVDIVGDAHALSKAIDGTVDYIFSISTFEHFLMPWKVVLEMNRVLAPGGLVFSHSHQTWPCHDEPWDFFRFSKWSWASLFNAHTGFKLLEMRHGEPVSVNSLRNAGGPFEDMDEHAGWGLSVSLAQKIGNAQVAWDADVNDVAKIEYLH